MHSPSIQEAAGRRLIAPGGTNVLCSVYQIECSGCAVYRLCEIKAVNAYFSNSRGMSEGRRLKARSREGSQEGSRHPEELQHESLFSAFGSELGPVFVH